MPASRNKVAPMSETPPTPGSTDFPRKLPNSVTQPKAPSESSTPAKDLTQTTQIVPPTVKSPILPQLANKMGRDEKFEWITGQLERENGNFVLYYATPETVDKYNGRIVLVPDNKTDLTQFRKGDLVSVRGTVTQRQTTQGAVPLYRVTIANLIERPKDN
jgi:uncharacterized cupin superfamily protein